MNKIAIVAVLLCLAIVPSFALRYRYWNENSKCRGGESGVVEYSNGKSFCQPSQESSSIFIKALTDCKNGKSVSVQRYSDGTCTTPVGDPYDSPVVNRGACISYQVLGQYSYMVDCSSASVVAPGLAILIALVALLLL